MEVAAHHLLQEKPVFLRHIRTYGAAQNNIAVEKRAQIPDFDGQILQKPLPLGRCFLVPVPKTGEEFLAGFPPFVVPDVAGAIGG